MTWQIEPALRLSERSSAWDDLQRKTTDTPFFEASFLHALLTEFGTGRELLAMHRSGQEFDAGAILSPAGRGVWQTFQPSQLPLGPWVTAQGDDLRLRMRSLLAALPGTVLGLGTSQLDPRLHPRPTEQRDLQLRDYIQTPFIEVQGSFDAYWEARGKNLRQNVRKLRNKLQAEGITPVLECATRPEQVASALATYGALETAGWKAGMGTAIHPDNAQGRFYTRAFEALCAQGRGRIYSYRLNDKVVSMDLCIDNGPLVVILKTAYDENFKHLSPSTLMRQDEFKAWWDEGQYRRIEFYGKAMEWHARWTPSERGVYHATLYRWPWLRALHDQFKVVRAPSPMAQDPVVSKAPEDASRSA